jgi:hypothetical protein
MAVSVACEIASGAHTGCITLVARVGAMACNSAVPAGRRTFESFRAKRGHTIKYRFGAAPAALAHLRGLIPQPFPLLPPLAALERVASTVFFTENRIECNAPTSTTGKQGPGWADVWRPALRALRNG